jgi:hypothetical protein
MLIWIIEHVLLVLPTWFWFLISGTGAIIYFFSNFISMLPLFAPYTKFVKAAGGIMLLIGVYLCGGDGVNATWQHKIQEMQDKVTQAEKISKDANDQLKKATQGKVKIIHDRQIVVQEKIIKDSAKMDAACIVDPVVIEDLNLAAGGKKK